MPIPLITGLLIDRTRLIWPWMLLFGAIPALTKLIPITKDMTFGWMLLECELNDLGYSAVMTCQVVMLSKWFKGQFSLPLVFGMYFTLVAPMMMGGLLNNWHKYIVPENATTKEGGLLKSAELD